MVNKEWTIQRNMSYWTPDTEWKQKKTKKQTHNTEN